MRSSNNFVPLGKEIKPSLNRYAACVCEGAECRFLKREELIKFSCQCSFFLFSLLFCYSTLLLITRLPFVMCVHTFATSKLHERGGCSKLFQKLTIHEYLFNYNYSFEFDCLNSWKRIINLIFQVCDKILPSHLAHVCARCKSMRHNFQSILQTFNLFRSYVRFISDIYLYGYNFIIVYMLV